jgi:hypothetical protein
MFCKFVDTRPFNAFKNESQMRLIFEVPFLATVLSGELESIAFVVALSLLLQTRRLVSTYIVWVTSSSLGIVLVLGEAGTWT